MQRSIIPYQMRVFAQHLCGSCRRDVHRYASRSFLTTASRKVPRPPTRTALPKPAPLSVQSTCATAYNSRQLAQSATAQTEARAEKLGDVGVPGSDARTPPLTFDGKTSSLSQSSHANIPKYYALFPLTLPRGPPPGGSFVIDARALRREYLRLQAVAHPDLRGGAGGAASAIINDAYRTLASPLTRAQYLLRELHGLDVAGDEAGAISGGADPEVFSTVLEAQEVIDEAEEEADMQITRQENEERILDAERGLENAFAVEDVAAAVREVVKLRYWINIRESVDAWEKGKGAVLIH